MIFGSDHSHWDWMNEDDGYCPIDWSASIAEFTFLKACDGAENTPYYADEIVAARLASKKAAPYVWCHGRNWYDPRRQAEFWYSRLKDEPLIAVDFESYSTSIPNYDDLYNAVNRLRELGYTGKLLLYTNWGYWLSYGTSAALWTRLFDGGIWLSDPDDDPPVAPPWASASEKARKAPTPFEEVAVHQFSFTGDPVEYGITNGKNDVDENKSAPEKIAVLFGGGTIPPIDPGEEPMILTSLENGLRIREGAGVSFPQVTVAPTYLDAGQTADVLELSGTAGSEQWAKIGDGRWANVWYNKYQNATLSGTLPPAGTLPTINIRLDAEGYPPFEGVWTPS